MLLNVSLLSEDEKRIAEVKDAMLEWTKDVQEEDDILRVSLNEAIDKKRFITAFFENKNWEGVLGGFGITIESPDELQVADELSIYICQRMGLSNEWLEHSKELQARMMGLAGILHKSMEMTEERQPSLVHTSSLVEAIRASVKAACNSVLEVISEMEAYANNTAEKEEKGEK